MFKLDCRVQNYEWGRIGLSSTVAQLAASGKHSLSIDNDTPYAELWMGVHPNGLSVKSSDKTPLTEVLTTDKNLLAEHEKGTLQFLFKVLSVNKALSVQSHPTKDEARELHSLDPKHYPDPNHKPEMAIALTEFQLLCGFRPAPEIAANLKEYKEVLDFLSTGTDKICTDDLLSHDVDVAKTALRQIFTTIWGAPPEDITKLIAEIIERLKKVPSPSSLQALLIRLDSEFPGGDVGVLAPLLLNYFTLQPGQSTFLGPNRPHAYLYGDCVECMACSDNTIRAGLTPKFKDITTLCKNLDYTMSAPPIFSEKQISEGLKLYAPPVPEFAVHSIEAPVTTVPNTPSSSLLIVVRGKASLRLGDQLLIAEHGDVLFIPHTAYQLLINNASSDFLAFQAYTPKP